jgi:hypothetical protein
MVFLIRPNGPARVRARRWQVRAARAALLNNKEWQKFNLMSVFGSSPAIRQQLELTVPPLPSPPLTPVPRFVPMLCFKFLSGM